MNATATQPRPPQQADPPPASMFERVQRDAARILARHSITVLRVSLGLVFLCFGALKFVPGASPAEDLAVQTIDTLTLGIVSGQMALLLTALTETFIGITMVTGRFVKAGVAVLAMALVGIMAPLVLFFGELFPGHVTLEAQYVFKDIVLASAGLVIAARTLGARLTPNAPSVSSRGPIREFPRAHP